MKNYKKKIYKKNEVNRSSGVINISDVKNKK